MTDLVEPIVRSPVPAPVLRTLSGLMQHQGWLWGRDVRCSTGNRLVAYGFERIPAPIEKTGGTTLYRRCEPERTILLWSWGFSFHRPGWPEAIHVSRGGGGVHAISLTEFAAPCWCYDDAKLSWRELAPEMIRCVPDALRWPAEFERWAQRTIGLERREEELREWHNAHRTAAGLPEDWDALADRWRTCLQSEPVTASETRSGIV